jgi:hypothetical protein
MSSQIDFRTLPANVPVLCIPRVYPNITEGRIRRIFDDLNMGELDRIDIVSKTSEKGDKFNRVFVHFKKWNTSENSNTARERLLNGKEIKIIYDDPWFWKISAYRESERKSAPQQQPSGNARKPTLAFDSDEEKSSKPAVSTNRDERRRDDRRRDERPRRRDDSRERSRRDDRPRRRDDSRERSRRDDSESKLYKRITGPLESNRRDDSRERSRRDDRPQRQEDKPVRKFVEPRTPSCSPQRERRDENAVIQTPIEYGDIMPPLKKRGKQPETKKVLKIEDIEEGEVKEEAKTQNT